MFKIQKNLLEILIAFTAIVILFTACEKEEKPYFAIESATITTIDNKQYIGVDRAVLVGDTFQVSFTISASTGNYMDELIIERLLDGVKTNVVPDSQPHGASWKYVDEFIANKESVEEIFRFTFYDRMRNKATKEIRVKTARMMTDSNTVTIFNGASKDNNFSFSSIGYNIGYDILNYKNILYSNKTGIGIVDTAFSDIISTDVGTFTGSFGSLNGRKFATGIATWKIDSIPDRDVEAVYLDQESKGTLTTQISNPAVGNYYVAKLTGHVNYALIKITEIDKNTDIGCINTTTGCYKGSLTFKIVKKAKL